MQQLSSINIVEFTLWILFGFSLVTWAIIFYKIWLFWYVNRCNRIYIQHFSEADDFLRNLECDHHSSVLGRISGVGYQTLQNIQKNATSMLKNSTHLESIMERSLRQQISKESKLLEQGLPILASIGSTSPFVGLFGTVWGIMHALQGISHAKSASIDIVAAPIGDALIATAMGIAAAVPAVLAYNFFLRRIKVNQIDYENFASHFLNLAILDIHQNNHNNTIE